MGVGSDAALEERTEALSVSSASGDRTCVDSSSSNDAGCNNTCYGPEVAGHSTTTRNLPLPHGWNAVRSSSPADGRAKVLRFK
jgi:hypothetical protein